jgi:hypothetical protein
MTGTQGATATVLPVPTDPILGEKAKTAREIIAMAQDAFNRKIITGKTGRRAAGLYMPSNSGILIRHTGDLVAAFHELGHMLDDAYAIIKAWNSPWKKSPYDDELKPFWEPTSPKSYSLRQKRAEGVAQWLLSSLVNPAEARRRAPKYAAFFDSKVPADVRAVLDDISTEIRKFAGALEEGRASNVEPISGNAEVMKPGELFTGWKNRFMQAFFNDKIVADQAFRKGMELLGITDVPPDRNFTDLRKVYNGVFEKTMWFGNHGLEDANGNALMDDDGVTPLTTEWLMDLPEAMQPSGKKMSASEIEAEANDAAEYGVAARTLAKAHYNLGREVHLSGLGAGLMPDAEAASRVIQRINEDPDRAARIRERFRRYEKFADAVLRYLVDRGRLSEDAYKAMKKANLVYIAMQRIREVAPGEEIVTRGGPSGKGLGSVSTPGFTMNFKGSDQIIRNPYISLMEALFSAVREGDRNEVEGSFIDVFLQVREMYDGQPVPLANIIRPAKAGEPNTISYFRDGKIEYYQMDAELFRVFKGLQNGYWRWPWVATVFTRIMRAGVVKAPPFMFRQRIRDPQHLAMVSDVPLKDVIPETLKPTTSTEDKALMMKSGAGQAGYFSEGVLDDIVNEVKLGREPGKARRHYYRLLREAMLEVSKDHGTLLLHPGKAMSHFWDKYNEFAENQSDVKSRLALFKAELKHAKDKLGYNDYQARIYAAARARDVIGDYAEAGSWIRFMGQIIPFLNPAFQFSQAQVRSMRRNPAAYVGKWAMIHLTMTLLARIWASMHDDEEEYKAMPWYLRDFFWNFKVGPNFHVRIPKDYLGGALSSMSERLIDRFAFGDEKALDGAWQSAVQAFFPVDISSLITPGYGTYLQIRSNRDVWTNRPIVPQYEQHLDVSLRDNDRFASRLGALGQKLTGDTLDARNVDFILRDMFGISGSLLSKASDIGRKDRPGLGIGDITGLTTQSPAGNSVDADWVEKFAARYGIMSSKRYRQFSNLKKQVYSTSNPVERDAAAEKLRAAAAKLRADWSRNEKSIKAAALNRKGADEDDE